MKKFGNRDWPFILLSAGVLLVGIALAWAGNAIEHWILTTLGQSFIVASVLGLTVDWYVKERLLRNATKNISEYLIGYGLPERLQRRIRAIMQVALVRSNYSQSYSLQEMPDGGSLRVTICYEFLLENFGSSSVEYQHKLELGESTRPEVKRIFCESSDPEARFGFSAVTKSSGAQSKIFTGPAIWITSNKSAPHYEYRIKGEYTIEPDETTDIIAIAANPVQDLKVEAEWPEGWEFFPAAIAEVTSSQSDTNHGIWRFDQALLPGEHVRFRWRRNPTQ